MTKRIIRLPEVKRLTGLSQSSIYSAIAESTFPEQIPLGGRAVGWREDEIDAWIESCVAQAQAHSSMHIKKAAEELNMTLHQLMPFIESGELPTYCLGRHQLVKKEALTAFRKKHQVQLQSTGSRS